MLEEAANNGIDKWLNRLSELKHSRVLSALKARAVKLSGRKYPGTRWGIGVHVKGASAN